MTTRKIPPDGEDRGAESKLAGTDNHSLTAGSVNTSTVDAATDGPTAAAPFQLLPPLSEADARRLTMQLKLQFGSIADQIDKVKELIDRAKAGQADVALGYKSWTAYCETEFAGSLPRLDRAHRLELVSSLTDMGMSSRAIAPIVGVDQKTVVRDRGEANASPDECSPDAEIVDAEIVEDDIQFDHGDDIQFDHGDDIQADHRPPITGRDGKIYTPPAPVKLRRRPLPDAYRTAVYDLQKAIERLERLHEDDRFIGNREALHEVHWRELNAFYDRLFKLEDHLFIGRRDDPDDDDPKPPLPEPGQRGTQQRDTEKAHE